MAQKMAADESEASNVTVASTETETWERQQEQKMTEILTELDAPDEVQAHFRDEKIYASTVELLTDSQLQELGITKMGDRATLRTLCKKSELCHTISDEVSRIMGPSRIMKPFELMERRPPKRRPKKGIAYKKYGSALKKGKHPEPSKRVTFQKKLVVISYMGPNAPKQFTLKEGLVAMRGLLPDIALDASEKDVRSEIASVITSFDDEMAPCTTFDFEFIEATGKSLCVPARQKGFNWSGKAIKNLAGSGQIYVRLTHNLTGGSSSDDNGFLPYPQSQESPIPSPDVAVVKVEPAPRIGCPSDPVQLLPPHPSSVHAPSTVRSDPVHAPSTVRSDPVHAPSTVRSDPVQHMGPHSSTVLSDPVQFAEPGPSSLHSAGSSRSFLSPSTDALLSSFPAVVELSGEYEPLHQMFPNVPEENLRFLYNLSNGDLSRASDCVLSGPSLESLLSLIRVATIKDESATRKLVINEDEEEGDDLVECVFAFYKGAKFDPEAGVRMSMKSQPAVDTGGVRRQVFAEVFKTVAFSDTLCLFEGPPDRRRPVFRISNLSAGMMKIVGRVVGHSIVLESQGFPYLSPACYRYMIGDLDQALLLCTPDDASEKVQLVLSELSKTVTLDSLGETKETLLDLMEQSGCDIPLGIAKKDSIAEAIYVYDALHKRKPFLDQLMQGLEEFQLGMACRLFPDLFQPLFISAKMYVPEDVLQILRTSDEMLDDRKQVVYQFLRQFLMECEHSELQSFLMYTTGSPHVQGNQVTISFTDEVTSNAFTASTCGKVFTLSVHIVDYPCFASALNALITTKTYTMP